MTNQQQLAKPIGLYGGSFDPIHNGHLRVALEAAERLQLEQVRLIPLHTPGHREQNQAPIDDRLAMLRLSLAPPLALDTVEIDRGGVSYTVDTLTALRDQLPNTPLCLILGFDSFAGLPRWHRPEAVLQLAHIVVAARGATTSATSAELDELLGNAHCNEVAALHNALAGRVYFLDSPVMPIASSDLRQRLREGRSIRYLVPAAVDDYLHEHRLYLA